MTLRTCEVLLWFHLDVQVSPHTSWVSPPWPQPESSFGFTVEEPEPAENQPDKIQ